MVPVSAPPVADLAPPELTVTTSAAAPAVVVATAGVTPRSAANLGFDPPPTSPGPLDPNGPTPGNGEPPWDKPPIPSGPGEPDCTTG